MKRIFLLFVLSISFTQCMAADILLDLHKSGDLIIISVINISQQDVKISRLFTKNPAFGLVEFYVSVKGRRHQSLTSPYENLPGASDYIILSPFDVVGEAFDISEIRRRYRTGKGCFDLHVEYHDVVAKKFGAYQGTIESNIIDVCEK